MDNARLMLSRLSDWALGRGAATTAEIAKGIATRPQTPVGAPGAPAARAETFSLDQVERFFAAPGFVAGNVFASEIVDENGPLPGREAARGRRKPGGLAMQFADDDSTRPVLFAPNDPPDELPKDPIELQATLRQSDTLLRHRYMV